MAGSSTSLKIFLTSRLYTEIETALFYKTGLNKNHVHLPGENDAERVSIEGEIELVIERRIADFRERRIMEGIDDCAHETLQDHLNRTKNRTYLWVSAVVDTLDDEAGAPESDLDTIISTLPENVDTAYESILIQTPKNKQATLKAIFPIMLAAFRPPSTQEMNVALAVTKEGMQVDMNSLLPRKAFRKWIRNLCGFFITVTEHETTDDGEVQEQLFFVHESAREFLLLKYSGQEGQGWRGSFEPAESHTLLARICIDFLRLVCNETCQELTEYESYAVESWFEHFQRATWNDDLRRQAATFMLNGDGTAQTYQSWIKKFRLARWREGGHRNEWLPWNFINKIDSESPAPFFLACHFGWVWLLEKIIPFRHFDWYHVNAQRNTGLAVASSSGQVGVVKFLLPRVSSDIVDIEDYLAIPLKQAAVRGHIEIVQILLDAGANADYVAGSQEFTALQSAASADHFYIVQKLIAAGADVNAAPSMYGGRTVLQAAAEGGHVGIIEKLIAAGADVNAAPAKGYGSTALQFAVKRDVRIVAKLLTCSANVDAPSSPEYSMALERAIQFLRIEAAEMLLAASADVNLHLEALFRDDELSRGWQRADDCVEDNLLDRFVMKLREAGAKEEYLPLKYR